MPPALREPLFILGNPRSGTTLLRLMLTCHRSIVIPPECGFAVWLYPRYRDWGPANAGARIGSFVTDVFGCRKIETWRMDEGALRAFLQEAHPTSYAEAASLVYQGYGRSQGRTFGRWGDKNNFYIDHLETLEEIFPKAFFLHLVRDARNVACSYKWLHETPIDSPYAPRLPWKSEDIARQWKENNDKIAAFLAGREAERGFVLRFEDLVAEPRRQLRRLCDALGEDYDPGMLDYPRRNQQEQLEPGELMAWKKKTLEPPQASEIDRYTRDLEREEVSAIERVAAETLRRYGYLT